PLPGRSRHLRAGWSRKLLAHARPARDHRPLGPDTSLAHPVPAPKIVLPLHHLLCGLEHVITEVKRTLGSGDHAGAVGTSAVLGGFAQAERIDELREHRA